MWELPRRATERSKRQFDGFATDEGVGLSLEHKLDIIFKHVTAFNKRWATTLEGNRIRPKGAARRQCDVGAFTGWMWASGGRDAETSPVVLAQAYCFAYTEDDTAGLVYNKLNNGI